MVSSKLRNIAIVVMLAWFVLSPYVLNTNNLSHSYDRIAIMEPAAPTISGPSTYQFENGTIGRTIVYHASDPNPKNYSVTAEGVRLDYGFWEGGAITVYLAWLYQNNLVDTLPKEITMVCTVFNQEGENASATTIITIILDETAPIIAQPNNITYEAGSFGHEIRWNITESNPDFYNVSRISNEPSSNESVIVSGPWDGRNITINVDGLNASRWYLYSLFVNDTFGRNSSSYVNVTVVPDLTYPTITSPDDIAYEFGDEGYDITWHAYDSNPKNYTVKAVILYNDTSYGNVSEFHTFLDIEVPDWTFSDPEGEDLVIDIDGLFLGNYTITLTLFDDFGRMTNDSVNVTIYPDIRAPIITSSGDLSYEEGYTGYDINWTIQESNPKSFNLTLNGETYDNGTWRGEEYVLNVDRFPVGIYLYNMTYTDFFNQSAFSLIEVEVTPDAHPPTVAQVRAIQTYSTPTSNNLSVVAYVWDLNNISDIEIQWGVGDPESVDFEFETENMNQSEIVNIFTVALGEYSHGVVVWFKVVAQDNSSVQLIFDTGWIAVEIIPQGIDRVPALLYAVVVIFGSLSLLVILVLYFRTKTR
ncbi:MAG: hypothetical protein AM325_007745 [Candidatus Thorarchaeota archaeon SMTZ1-45]|nr:MAG: hypothetical protein AM325_09470 [Candidatus Thorarchaeota archaeon SMTZ1-45]